MVFKAKMWMRPLRKGVRSEAVGCSEGDTACGGQGDHQEHRKEVEMELPGEEGCPSSAGGRSGSAVR